MGYSEKLSELTGMKYYYFAHALDIPTGGDYGNVILSKYPVSEEKSFKLSVLKEGDYVRSFGYVKVAKEGKEFYFATTHLDHKYEDAARLKQIDEILACVEQLDKPVILGRFEFPSWFCYHGCFSKVFHRKLFE